MTFASIIDRYPKAGATNPAATLTVVEVGKEDAESFRALPPTAVRKG